MMLLCMINLRAVKHVPNWTLTMWPLAAHFTFFTESKAREGAGYQKGPRCGNWVTVPQLLLSAGSLCSTIPSSITWKKRVKMCVDWSEFLSKSESANYITGITKTKRYTVYSSAHVYLVYLLKYFKQIKFVSRRTD